MLHYLSIHLSSAVLRNKGYVELYNVSASQDYPIREPVSRHTRKFIADNPPIVENFMKAILEAIVLIKNDPEGSKAVMAKYLIP